MVSARFNCSSESGFSLIETITSAAILMTVSLGVAQMFIYAADQTRGGKTETSATTLAEQKLEQLRSLTWGFDTEGLGLPASDTTTNLAVDPADDTGTGLNPSPGNVLNANTVGFVDFLDANGGYVGTVASNNEAAPAGAVYIRRWSIEPLPTNPNNTLVLQVFVTTKEKELRRGAASNRRQRVAGDAWLTTVKTRKSS